MYKTPGEHKEAIMSWFNKAFVKKYDVGQIEHDGRLWNKNTQDMLEEEAIDFISYVFTRREQVNKATLLLEKALFTDGLLAMLKTSTVSDNTYTKIKRAYYLLQYGNVDGILEKDK